MVRFSDILKRSGERERKEPKREEPKKEEAKPSEEIKLKEKVEIKGKKYGEVYAEAVECVKDTLNKAQKGRIIERKNILGVINGIIDQLSDSNQEMLLVLTQSQKESSYPGYLRHHLVNVCILAINLGLDLEYDRMKLLELGISALLHDIGMIKVPRAIVNKPSKLLEKEFAEVKKHPGYALDMLKGSKEISEPMKEAIHQHHELLNGEGYPQGLKEDQICEYAKIISLVDIYEALTSPRIYRDKLIPNEALALIINTEKEMTPYEAMKTTLNANEEGIFVSEMLKLFVKQMTIYPVGSFVKLNNDEVGFVLKVNKDFPMKPTINVLFDSGGNKLTKPKIMDLAKSPLLYIEKPLEAREYK
jgi:HD-GYP domain-containing protein (c-di-GMP phosphodiesterase class II)